MKMDLMVLLVVMDLEPPKKKSKGLSKILAHPQLDVEDSPLEWWKVEHSRYPQLAKLAHKYRATSVPSERVFSCAGQIVSDHRSSLKPDRVNDLVFLARNLK